jgi:hypothetical protein
METIFAHLRNQRHRPEYAGISVDALGGPVGPTDAAGAAAVAAAAAAAKVDCRPPIRTTVREEVAPEVIDEHHLRRRSCTRMPANMSSKHTHMCGHASAHAHTDTLVACTYARHATRRSARMVVSRWQVWLASKRSGSLHKRAFRFPAAP